MLDHMDLTYLTLVSLKKRIILNSSYRKNRSGASWDLAGAVAKVINQAQTTMGEEAVSSEGGSRGRMYV